MLSQVGAFMTSPDQPIRKARESWHSPMKRQDAAGTPRLALLIAHRSEPGRPRSRPIVAPIRGRIFFQLIKNRKPVIHGTPG
jgi:hypothetical protein